MFNVEGVGGDYERILLDGPCFQYPIHVLGEVIWEGSRGMLSISEAGPSTSSDK